MRIFYFFAAALIWLGLVSLRGGWAYLAYVRREMSRERSGFAPFASVVAPCRGMDQGLFENLCALYAQDYPAYEIIFVTDKDGDASLPVIEAARREAERASRERNGLETMRKVRARVVIAGQATKSGQKVHNLCAAVRAVDPMCRVLVFVDSDARPATGWLRSLVAPLVGEQIGATTGYRWFIPVQGGFSSHLRAVWNASIASALGARGDKNFCWGGSTAIRLETFRRINMLDEWRGALSDDFALMRALRRAGLSIHFVPQCLTPSHEDCNFRELLEFSTRQLKITRVYAPEFWRAVFAGSLIFALVFFGGIVLVIARAALGLSFVFPLTLLMVIFLLGAWKSFLRWRAVSLALAPHRAALRRGLAAHLLLWPLASALYLYNAICAAASRRIRWRGICYELKSPTETVIIARRAEPCN